MWKEISRNENKPEGFKRTTHALEIAGMGCLVQVTAERGGLGRSGGLSTSVTFVPCVHLRTESSGNVLIVADEDDSRPPVNLTPLTPAQINQAMFEDGRPQEAVTAALAEAPVVEPVLIADPEAPEPQVVEAAPATKGKKK